MSDKDEKPESPKKGKGFIKMALIGLVLAGAGGGAVFGLMSAGIIGANPAHAKPTGPQLVMKGDDDPYAAPKKEEKGSVPLVHGEGGSKYRTTYYTFAEDFTSNLKDSDALVQMSLAAATRRDGRVLMWMDEHALAIRSEVLIILADTPEGDAYTVEGKKRLQQRLTKAVNDVLTEEEGFGGVDNVYFRNFIVQ